MTDYEWTSPEGIVEEVQTSEQTLASRFHQPLSGHAMAASFPARHGGGVERAGVPGGRTVEDGQHFDQGPVDADQATSHDCIAPILELSTPLDSKAEPCRSRGPQSLGNHPLPPPQVFLSNTGPVSLTNVISEPLRSPRLASISNTPPP